MITRARDPDREPEGREIEFEFGAVYATAGVLEKVSPLDLASAMRRHIRGDWGELDDEDKRANDEALKHGARLLSKYTTKRGVTFWVITEAGRSKTTALLPSEY